MPFVKPLESVKGPPFGKDTINIRFALGEDNVSVSKGERHLIPAKGSKWILLIPKLIPTNGMFNTLPGVKGKIECNPANLRKVLTSLGMKFDERLLDPTNFDEFNLR